MKLADQDVKRLADLLLLRRKRLGSKVLDLAQLALEQIFEVVALSCTDQSSNPTISFSSTINN